MHNRLRMREEKNRKYDFDLKKMFFKIFIYKMMSYPVKYL